MNLSDILKRREERAELQKALVSAFSLPLVSFTVNIPGEIKRCEQSKYVFSDGATAIREAFAGNLLYFRTFDLETGYEAVAIIDENSIKIKEKTCEIEENHTLGRFFDIDVIDENMKHLSREDIGFSPRKCFLCDKNAKLCAVAQTHKTEELLAFMDECITKRKIEKIAEKAYAALISEVFVTPKPGLVDKENNGSHSDMDLALFVKSAAAIKPYFEQIAFKAHENAQFSELREIGKQAENAMFSATNGVNTHKGAIFSLGLLCASYGRLIFDDANALCEDVRILAKGISNELGRSDTHGEKAFAEAGAKGARGEAEGGFSSVLLYGLPTYENALSEGMSKNDAAVKALLSLIANVRDTNIISRGGKECEESIRREAQAVLSDFSLDTVRHFGEKLVKRNISPGGCADLLAITLFLHSLKN